MDLQGEREDLDWSHVRAQFEALAASDEIKVGEGKLMSFDALIGGTSEVFEGKISNARAYAHRLDTFTALSRNGHSFLNGKYFALEDVPSVAILSNEHPLIASREFPGLAANQCRTSSSVLPREGHLSVLVLTYALSS